MTIRSKQMNTLNHITLFRHRFSLSLYIYLATALSVGIDVLFPQRSLLSYILLSQDSFVIDSQPRPRAISFVMDSEGTKMKSQGPEHLRV